MAQIRPLSLEQQQQMELIDRVKLEAMVHAEAKCCNFCMGKVDISVDLNMIRGQKFCWMLIVNKKCSGGNVSSNKIHQVAKAVGIIGNPLHTSITL
jgi:hypothetical protein